MTNIDEPIDMDAVEERLYEMYQIWCDNNGLKSTLKGYLLWLEERYE